MGYQTPHSNLEYLSASCLAINHEYIIRCQGRNETFKRKLITSTREIDLCARLANYFGQSAFLAAQGTNDIDVQVTAPIIRCEVKYCNPTSKPPWAEMTKDWEWLLEGTNNGKEFSKKAWIVFWPSTSLYKFTSCLSITKSHVSQYSNMAFAPFAIIAQPELPKKGTNQRLIYKEDFARTSLLNLPGGKKVRCDIVGSRTNPIWALIYTRATPNDCKFINPADTIELNNDPIAIY